MLRLLIILAVSSGWNVEAFLPRFPVDVANKFGLNTIHDPETDRIVGGEEAGPGEFPFQCSIQRIKGNGKSSSHYCGGSIYSNDCIVTAAHCSSPPPEKIRIYVGSQQLQSTAGSYYNVKYVTKHQDYNPQTINNDVAIMKLATPLNFSDSVKAIPLHEGHEAEDIVEGTDCTCSGWGTTAEGGSIPTHLHKVTIPVISKSNCKKYYGESEITDSMICAGLPAGGKDSCQGDSGGPLVTDSKLVGVVSWGYGCARPQYPGVYTNIRLFREWVEKECSSKP